MKEVKEQTQLPEDRARFFLFQNDSVHLPIKGKITANPEHHGIKDSNKEAHVTALIAKGYNALLAVHAIYNKSMDPSDLPDRASPVTMVSFVGVPGVGKSTITKYLESELGLPRIDMDPYSNESSPNPNFLDSLDSCLNQVLAHPDNSLFLLDTPGLVPADSSRYSRPQDNFDLIRGCIEADFWVIAGTPEVAKKLGSEPIFESNVENGQLQMTYYPGNKQDGSFKGNIDNTDLEFIKAKLLQLAISQKSI